MYTLNGIPVLKAIAFKSGDGWKDTTEKGDEVYVWGVIQTPPYIGNSLLRVGRGRWTWSVSPETHYYRSLSEPESQDFLKRFPDLREDLETIHSGLQSGSLVSISDMDSFLKDLGDPETGGIVGNYQRMGIHDYKQNNYALKNTRGLL